MNFKNLIKISRPRFWLYAGGTFAVGIIAGASNLHDLYSWQYLLFLVYFMVPANIFIYGINDLYDDDTDFYNSKKDVIEHRLQVSERQTTKLAVLISILLGIVVIWFSPNWESSALVAVFLFLAWAYSSKPFRFKSKPFIDAISNVHYAVIGFAGYAMLSGGFPPAWAIVAAWSWTASMHIFSAVPDIESDSKANLTTTAVLLQQNKSLILCSLLWLVTSVSMYWGNFYWPITSILMLLFVVTPLFLINKNHATLTRVYWYFPIINGVYGFALFWLLALPKI